MSTRPFIVLARLDLPDSSHAGLGTISRHGNKLERDVKMDPQVVIIAGSTYQLQSRELLSQHTGGSIPSNELMGEAIMTLQSAMTEAETLIQQCVSRNVPKNIFIFSPGYAALPELCNFCTRW